MRAFALPPNTCVGLTVAIGPGRHEAVVGSQYCGSTFGTRGGNGNCPAGSSTGFTVVVYLQTPRPERQNQARQSECNRKQT